jgi:DNA-binding GntR family transcriptional regulator
VKDQPVASVRQVADRSVVDQVTDELRRAIVSGRLAPGREFSLREMAAQLGVSFIPVREALRSLEGEGLVVTRPNRSAMVAPLDPADLHAIYQLRRQIEPDLAADARKRLRPEQLDRLEASLELFADPRHGIEEIYDAHHAFHLELLRPAATVWHLRILEILWRAAERYIRVAFGELDPDPAEHRRRSHAHGELLIAFRSGDARAVRRAWLAHLDENEQIAFGETIRWSEARPGRASQNRGTR